MPSVSFSLEHALAPEAEHVEATAFQASEMTEAGAQVDSGYSSLTHIQLSHTVPVLYSTLEAEQKLH